MTRRIPLPLFVFLALLAGCQSELTQPPPPETTQVHITGQVHHRLSPGMPLAGVALSWGGVDVLTDEEGGYEIETEREGGDTLRANHAEFWPEQRWVNPTDGEAHESFTLLPFDTLPPPAPLDFRVRTLEGERLLLTWIPPADSSDLAGYWLTKSPGDPQAQAFDISVTSWEDISVAMSREYTYGLSSRDRSGNLSEPLVATAQVDGLPATPTLQISLGATGFDSIPLSWSQNPDEDFAFYRLFRSEDAQADSTDLLLLSSSVREDTSYVDHDVVPNAVYHYRLYVHDEGEQVSVSTSRVGAAQVFIEHSAGQKTVTPLPGSDRFLVAGLSLPEVFTADASGDVIDQITVENAPDVWRVIDGGTRAWGLDTAGYLVLIQTDPLAILREGEFSPDASDFVYLGGDSLLLTPLESGPALLYDGLSFEPLDTLDVVPDLAAGSLAAADSAAKKLFLAESGGARRLLRLDLGGEPVLEEFTLLPSLALEILLATDGGLLVASIGSSILWRYDSADLGQSTSIDCGGIPVQGCFTPDGGQWWMELSQSWLIYGFALDFGAGSAEPLGAFGMIASPGRPALLSDASLLATPLHSGQISLCDPGRGHD